MLKKQRKIVWMLLTAAWIGCFGTEMTVHAQEVDLEDVVITPELVGDGIYTMELEVKGADGQVESPAQMTISAGQARVLLVWNRDDYEYLTAEGEEYERLDKSKTSEFEIPVSDFYEEITLTVSGGEDMPEVKDTYTLTMDPLTITKDGMNPRTLGLAIGSVAGVAVVCVVIFIDQKHEKKKKEKSTLSRKSG